LPQLTQPSLAHLQADKASVQTIFRAGKVTLAHFPRLSSDALRILRTAPDPSRTFSEAFGDYFVGGYILGGTNSTIVWGQGASERSASRLDATYEVHALFLSYEDEYHSASEASASVGQASLTAFDSLENYQVAFEAHDYAGFRRALQASSDNRSRGSKIQGRARKKLRDLGLGLPPPSCASSRAAMQEMRRDKCADLFKQGLVLELLLLPWHGLREYRSALARG
jgi:hypothetical protein